MANYRTWTFRNYYDLNKYKENPNPINTKLRPTYQWARHIITESTEQPIMDTMDLLNLTPDNLDAIKQTGAQRKWHLTSITLENTKSHIIKFVPYAVFGNQGRHPIEHLAIQLRTQYWKMIELHFHRYKHEQREVIVKPPFDVTYRGIKLTQFRSIWTAMVGATQGHFVNSELHYYPMIYGPIESKLPDFNMVFPSGPRRPNTTKQIKRWIWANYTVKELPEPTHLYEHDVASDETIEYLMVRNRKLNQKNKTNA